MDKKCNGCISKKIPERSDTDYGYCSDTEVNKLLHTPEGKYISCLHAMSDMICCPYKKH